MLDDLEKEKIRLEEHYRIEVRSQLEKKQPKKTLFQSFLLFLNSSLGVWVLGAIFITWGATAFQDYKSDKEEKIKSEEAIGRIDYEIKYRLTQVLIDLYESSFKIDTNAVRNITYSLNTSGKSLIYLYPDYKGWSFLSLMAEEKRLLNHNHQDADDIKDVIMHVSGLQVFMEVNKLHFDNPKGIAIAIQEKFYLPRWKYDKWYFSEGGAKDPWP